MTPHFFSYVTSAVNLMEMCHSSLSTSVLFASIVCLARRMLGKILFEVDNSDMPRYFVVRFISLHVNM